MKFFVYNGVLAGQTAAAVVSALIALDLPLLCNPMAQDRSKL